MGFKVFPAPLKHLPSEEASANELREKYKASLETETSSQVNDQHWSPRRESQAPSSLAGQLARLRSARISGFQMRDMEGKAK